MSITTIKIIALLLMTADHIAVFFASFISSNLYNFMRILGRAAAPLFLFAMIIGLHKTSNRRNYVKRIYIANLLDFVFSLPFVVFLGGSAPKMLSTLFITAEIIYLLEIIIHNIIEKNILKSILMSCILISIIIFPILIDRFLAERLCSYLYKKDFSVHIINAVFRDGIRILFPNILTIDYSLMFIIMGITMYYANSKCGSIVTIVIFSAISFLGRPSTIFIDFFISNQYYMILSCVPIIFYNNQRGKNIKLLFYIYYPVHYQLLFLISTFIP